MKNKLVSILIPAYNAEKYIGVALDSALNQTYKNLEIVVVNDGSRDNTEAVIKNYRDRRLRYFSQENRGIARTRNKLLREAKGEYITFLDSDDIYLPDKVREEVEFLETNSDYGAVYCDLRYFFDENPNKLYRHKYVFHSGDILAELLKRQFITNTTLMLRRSVIEKIGDFNEEAREVEDWSYFLRMSRAGIKFGFIKEDSVRFRLRWDNNTRFDKQLAIQSDALEMFERLRKEMSAEEIGKYNLEKIIFSHKLRVVLMYLANGKKTEANSMLSGARSSFGWRTASVLVSLLFFLLPTKLLCFVIKKTWNFKKKNLFVLVRP